MTKINNVTPKNKEDIDFINNLKQKKISEIKDMIPELLEWTQDGNWPQARLIIDYFLPHINEIDTEIVKILNGNDSIWKYWILLGLIYNSETRPSDKILTIVYDLYHNPSIGDKEEEIDSIAQEIIEKWGNG